MAHFPEGILSIKEILPQLHDLWHLTECGVGGLGHRCRSLSVDRGLDKRQKGDDRWKKYSHVRKAARAMPSFRHLPHLPLACLHVTQPVPPLRAPVASTFADHGDRQQDPTVEALRDGFGISAAHLQRSRIAEKAGRIHGKSLQSPRPFNASPVAGRSWLQAVRAAIQALCAGWRPVSLQRPHGMVP